jgi:hypothetical protein
MLILALSQESGLIKDTVPGGPSPVKQTVEDPDTGTAPAGGHVADGRPEVLLGIVYLHAGQTLARVPVISACNNQPSAEYNASLYELSIPCFLLEKKYVLFLERKGGKLKNFFFLERKRKELQTIIYLCPNCPNLSRFYSKFIV